jgi:hypothetical protein
MAGELGEHAVAELEGGDQLGVAGRQGGGAFLGDDGRRLGPAGQVVLGVLDDGVEGVALRRGGGGQVVVALGLRAVVGIDGGPAAAPPCALVPHRLVGGADPVPVQLDHLAVLVGHAVAGEPPAGHVAVDRPRGDGGMTAVRDAQPELVAAGRGNEAPQQPGVVQPLLQEPPVRPAAWPCRLLIPMTVRMILLDCETGSLRAGRHAATFLSQKSMDRPMTAAMITRGADGDGIILFTFMT